MIFKTKHYVTFLSPGTLFSESSTKEIDSWDTKKAVEMAEKILERYNAKPYGFRFSTYKTHEPVSDGEGGTLEVRPKLTKESGLYFLGGKLETYDDVVRRNSDKEQILRDNMRFNDIWIVCINDNSWRATMPFEESSAIVDARGAIIEKGDDPKYIQYRQEQKEKRKAELGF